MGFILWPSWLGGGSARLIVLALQLRELQHLILFDTAVVPRLFPHSGRVNNQCVLGTNDIMLDMPVIWIFQMKVIDLTSQHCDAILIIWKESDSKMRANLLKTLKMESLSPQLRCHGHPLQCSNSQSEIVYVLLADSSAKQRPCK